MGYSPHYLSADIKRSDFGPKPFRAEVLFEQHMLVWSVSGETKLIMAGAVHLFGPGAIFLIPRNQLATVMNYPKDGLTHRAVVMHLSAEKLKLYYDKHKAAGKRLYPTGVRDFGRHPLLESCLASLVPYFDLQGGLPEQLAALKIEEAISILRIIDPGIDGLLANFNDPGKIDLAGFMERNFMFPMPIEKFGYLTGRSLTTFKRDFKKIFHTTPQRWLTQKRLELAHYQIREQKRKPSEVYAEVGFENLSHFTYAFKKQFGYSPAAHRFNNDRKPVDL